MYARICTCNHTGKFDLSRGQSIFFVPVQNTGTNSRVTPLKHQTFVSEGQVMVLPRHNLHHIVT
jgi:hypothetical protein